MITRAQKHGGACFCRAPRQPEQKSSTAGCASTERPPRQPKGATARRRALLHGATSAARAQQRGGVRFYRAAQLHFALTAGLGAKHTQQCRPATNRFLSLQLRGALAVELRHFEDEEAPVAPINHLHACFLLLTPAMALSPLPDGIVPRSGWPRSFLCMRTATTFPCLLLLTPAMALSPLPDGIVPRSDHGSFCHAPPALCSLFKGRRNVLSSCLVEHRGSPATVA
jgi:hypothetical protein